MSFFNSHHYGKVVKKDLFTSRGIGPSTIETSLCFSRNMNIPNFQVGNLAPKRIEENQRDQNENLRRYIDSTVGRVDSKVDETTTYQTSQKATVDSLTRFVTDIGAAKKPNQTLQFDLSRDDSLDVTAPQGTKPKVRLSDHETMINTRRGAGLRTIRPESCSTDPFRPGPGPIRPATRSHSTLVERVPAADKGQ